jgi:hypothetical protein
MTNRNDQFRARRSLLAGMGVAAAGVVAGGSPASAQDGPFRPTREDSDGWMNEMPGGHRVWIDTSYGLGGMEALHYANNILTAHTNVDSGKDGDYALVICWRHYATALGFTDAMWAKYGRYFSSAMQLMDPRTGQPFDRNPANIPDRPNDLDNGGDTIDKMRGRGVTFALCNAATRWYSRVIAGETGSEAADIYEEFVNSTVPDSRFVAAGVFATTRAQEYGYSLLYAG